MDEGTPGLGGLESEDDAKPSHGFLAVLSSLWGRAYLTHRLRTQSPEDKGVRRPKQPDQQTIPITWPFAVWGLDLVGPLQKAPGAYTHLMVAIDKFSKWVEV